jgi:carbamoyltransferase
MIILGVNAFGLNPSACIVRDGRLEAFCQEDRFTRLKGSYGAFPSHAVTWCLRSQELAISDVDFIAFSWGCDKYPLRMAWFLGRSAISGSVSHWKRDSPGAPHSHSLGSVLEYLNTYTPNTVRQKIFESLRIAGHKGDIPPVVFADHHDSHAFQTYYQSPFEKSAVLVADGSGEENCVSGYSMDGPTLHKLFSYEVPQSLGWFYSAFTSYLGFVPNRDEGKVMGLAAMGEERRNMNPWLDRFDSLFRVNSDGFALDPSFFKFGSHNYHPRFTDRLPSYITSFDPDLVPVGYGELWGHNGSSCNRYLLPGYVDLAFAAQSRLEDAVGALVSRLLRESKMTNLCLAGGVFMNCKVNGGIQASHPGINLFVHPASSDDGACIGAAFSVARRNGHSPKHPLTTVQIGPSYSNGEIENALRVARLPYSTPRDLPKAVAELVAGGKCVGWFQGGAEMGARALGGRSIVANPANRGIKERLNNEIKFREFWRPFCPSMTEQSASRYLSEGKGSDYMIVAGSASDELRSCAPAVVHVDNSVRPQVVKQSILPKWHAMLKAVGENTGHPLVLNTSLNVRGEPIDCSPTDAIRTLCSTGLDALAIGDFLVVKS